MNLQPRRALTSKLIVVRLIINGILRASVKVGDSKGRNLELQRCRDGQKNSDAIKQRTDPLEPEPSSLNQYPVSYPCPSYVSNFVYTSTCHLFYNNSTFIMYDDRLSFCFL